jgi:hypothetical protein
MSLITPKARTKHELLFNKPLFCIEQITNRTARIIRL